ncbi:MAG TPA: hypothetical protein VLL75_03985 [Vicinamibacteria bacterium]|nr:hypothetical protein [Vicinamibacteria bacterium]
MSLALDAHEDRETHDLDLFTLSSSVEDGGTVCGFIDRLVQLGHP